jgi:hypothetical protein
LGVKVLTGGVYLKRTETYIKAYKYYRDDIDDRVSLNSKRIYELERMIELIVAKLMEELDNGKKK